MNTSLLPRIPHRIAAALALACLVPMPLSAATVSPILAYGFDQGELFRSMPDLLAPGVSAEAWVTAGNVATSSSGNPGRALSATGWLSDSNGNAFVLRVRLSPGSSLALSGFGFDERASATGASTWELSIADVLVAAGATHTAFTRHAGLVALPGSLSGQFDVVLRGFGASSASGTWRFDNFFLEGTVLAASQAAANPVPLPGAGLLLAAPLGLLPARWRRRGADQGVAAPAPARQLRQPPSSGK